MSPRGRRSPGGVSEEIRRRHSWLELVQTSGPFLTLPVVHRVIPNGLPRVPNARGPAELRSLVAAMLDSRGASRHAVIETLLRRVLDWDDHLLLDGDVPAALTELGDHGLALRPDFAFYADQAANDDGVDEDPDDEEPEDDAPVPATPSTTGPYRLLGMYAPWDAHPFARTTEGGRTASPVERLAVLLRARDVPIGVVTDGRWWAVVWAPRGGATGAAVWDAGLFGEEPDSLRALVALLERARFTGVPADDTLPALLHESLGRQEEVTERLGEQVREAVELLVAKLDERDADSGGRLLDGVDDDELYEGVVTVMMRIVFMLFAEERRLLPSDADLYLNAYSIGQLVDQLEQRAQLAGEQSLEHRTGAWHRLLAVSRAVHGGVAHEDLRLPAYGGGLFDPDQHPWLEGRRAGEPVGGARPPAVDDRTVLRMLRAVQYVELGGERRRLTFRAIDVEQIGYVYEGLLELEVRTADDVVLHFVRPAKWPRGGEPSEVALSEAVSWLREGTQRLVERLRKRTGWTASRLERDLRRAIGDDELAELRRAVNGNVQLGDHLIEFIPVLEHRERRPVITLKGRRYVAPSTRRAASGTHYTPKFLAEEIASGALEALVYRPGPLETGERSQWQLRPSSELLDLRIADIAMGSGAFLVAACRYLADRLVEAWEAEGREEALRARGAREGAVLAVDAEVDQVLLNARRLVAEHCLYGVDVNPLAVEMAKLSLWLVTMDDERPFGFLDDRLLCGDSLLGLASFAQLETLHVDPVAGRKLYFGREQITAGWRKLLERAADRRRQITAAPVTTVRDVEHKQRLLAEANRLTDPLRVVADAITGRGLASAAIKGQRLDDAFLGLGIRINSALRDDAPERLAADTALLQEGTPEGLEPRGPFHWPLAFPEVLVDTPNPGFDAIIGNPPFLGGTYVSGRLGTDYLRWLQRWDGHGVKGNTDLAARFVLRAQRLLSSRGQFGYVATNSLVQGDTLEVGLAQAVAHGMHIRSGRSSRPWPSDSANIEIVDVWASRVLPSATALHWLDGEQVPS